jgi:hypothetical protein
MADLDPFIGDTCLAEEYLTSQVDKEAINVRLGVGNDAIKLLATSTDNPETTLQSSITTTSLDNLSDMTVATYMITKTNEGVPRYVIVEYTRKYRSASDMRAYTATVTISSFIGSVDPGNRTTYQFTLTPIMDLQGNLVFRAAAIFGADPLLRLEVVVLIPAARELTLSASFTYVVPLAEVIETIGDSFNLRNGSGQQSNQLSVNWTTDAVGANLAEIVMAISAPSRYVGGYTSKWIGRNRNLRVSDRRCSHYPTCSSWTSSCANITFFAFRPRIVKTLDGCGDYDLQRVTQLRRRYNITLGLEAFYVDVMSYAVLKYCLAGLITGEFDIAWLYQSQNAAFFELLANSEFASLLSQFLPCVGYEKYFLWFQ